MTEEYGLEIITETADGGVIFAPIEWCGNRHSVGNWAWIRHQEWLYGKGGENGYCDDGATNDTREEFERNWNEHYDGIVIAKNADGTQRRIYRLIHISLTLSAS